LRQLQWKLVWRAVFCSGIEEYSHSIDHPTAKESTMNRSVIALAALSLAALTAHAEDADPSGQFAAAVTGQASRAEVQAQFADYRQAGVNPWSQSYNPLKSFQGQKTRAEVAAEYAGSRAASAALTGEDSGSAWLAAHQATRVEGRQLAGQPVNAQ
jgi:hypothetical protein